ncbi:MAG: kelch repeat-containing protein [Gallionellaceae bacterium]|nr:kelch repeat-containing protein [Gallionellaceae bacterium]
MKVIKKILLGLSVFGLIASLPAYACGPYPQMPCPSSTFTTTPTPTPPVVLTAIDVTPVNHTINVGESQQYTATGTFSDGTSHALVGGSGAWVGKASMPTARFAMAAGIVNGTLYAVGGFNSSGALTTMEAYDPVTNTWTPKASMSTPRYLFAVEVVNSMVYAVGGDRTYPGGTLATVEAYDPMTNTWIPKASMSIRREGPAAGAVNNILYVAGGCCNNGVLATMEAYDPRTNTWTPRASMSTPRFGFALGVINGVLYAVGGYNEISGYLATTEAYDPASNTWMPKASMLTPRSGFAMGVVNGMLYAVGGGNSSGTLATVEVYDPVTNTWADRPSMLTPRSSTTAGVINGTLYAMGGTNTFSSFLETMEAYTPPDNITWDSSTPGVATIDQTGLVFGTGAGSTAITATSGSISGSTSLKVVDRPDLVVTTVTSALATVERGKTITFNSTTKNQGTATTVASTSTGLYLSTDAVITTADILVGSVSVASLAAGTSQSAATSITVSKKLARGTYYLGAIADYTNAETESNESNNSYTGTTIQVK